MERRQEIEREEEKKKRTWTRKRRAGGMEEGRNKSRPSAGKGKQPRHSYFAGGKSSKC